MFCCTLAKNFGANHGLTLNSPHALVPTPGVESLAIDPTRTESQISPGTVQQPYRMNAATKIEVRDRLPPATSATDGIHNDPDPEHHIPTTQPAANFTVCLNSWAVFTAPSRQTIRSSARRDTSTLALFVTRIERTNDVDTPLSPNHFATFANTLHARSNLHLTLTLADQTACGSLKDP